MLVRVYSKGVSITLIVVGHSLLLYILDVSYMIIVKMVLHHGEFLFPPNSNLFMKL